MAKVIVFGGGGQLGQCIRWVTNSENVEGFLFPDASLADILNVAALEELFQKEKPDYVINCAAYTAVDKAEEEEDIARKVNRDGAANLASLCAKYNLILIHISTDFVFAGDSVIPLTESYPARPISIYGLTKLEGEKIIRETSDKHFIFRTSWLYSEYGNNFVKTMLKLGNERSDLKVVADQLGTPTYAVDLARVILQVVISGSTSYGLYHYSNLGTASWYDFAKAIFELSSLEVKVIPIPASEYVTKARRPAFSIMDKSKAELRLGLRIPHWHDSLKICLKRLGNLS